MAGQSLPAADPALRSRQPAELSSTRAGARIWWLEDDRRLCQLMENRLRACGWQLKLFHKGQALLDALQADQPDLLILDRLMPGLNGMAVLEQLRQSAYEFPVLMLTVLGNPEERIEGLSSGANDYLTKPFHSRELIWRIERLLQGKAEARLPRLSQLEKVPLGPLTLEPGQCCLRDASGVEVPLSRGDIALLLMLLDLPGTVLSRSQLARASGSLVDVVRSRSLDVRLSRLRKVLGSLSEGDVGIEAVRGQGYRLRLPMNRSEPPGTKTLGSIVILSVTLGLVAIKALLALPWLVYWAVGLSGLLIIILMQQYWIIRLRRSQMELMRQTVEKRDHWQLLLHDQYAPLTRLILRMEDLHPDQPAGQELIDELRCDLKLMRQLQQQMRAMQAATDPNSGRHTVQLERLCRRVACHYRRNCIQLDVPQLMVRLDVRQLQRVLHNLIDNALEYGSPPVRIHAALVPGGLVLEVADPGPPLTSASSELVPGGPHAGLGMALAVEFCSRHGGRVELEPRAARGLLVRLRLGQDCVLHSTDSEAKHQRQLKPTPAEAEAP